MSIRMKPSRHARELIVGTPFNNHAPPPGFAMTLPRRTDFWREAVLCCVRACLAGGRGKHDARRDAAHGSVQLP